MTGNVFSLEAALEWARSKHPEEKYDYWSVLHCACGQYAKHLGVEKWWGQRGGFWDKLNGLAGTGQKTFGSLADRIERVVGK